MNLVMIYGGLNGKSNKEVDLQLTIKHLTTIT